MLKSWPFLYCVFVKGSSGLIVFVLLIVYFIYQYLETSYSLNAVEWKSTLLGVILGIASFGVEIHSQNSGIHSKVVV